MELRYEYTRLLTEDFGACFRFLRDALGFRCVFGTEADSYADFDAGPVHISLFDRREMGEAVGAAAVPAREPLQDAVCLVFAVADVDATAARWSSMGVPLVAAPTDHPEWGIRTAHVRDPDGRLIEVNQPLPTAP